MSLLIQYLVKLTISLAVVWLFYQFILRRLTFYNSNRWYLLGYTLLSFLIPFINISSIIQTSSNDVIQYVPSVHQYTIALEEASHCPIPIWSTNYDKWDFIAFGLITVAGLLLIRFAISYISFLNIQRKAKLISEGGVKIYQVDENIMPFSFGNSIFINSSLHTEAELEEIVRHEFVHVRQKHTIDIIWAEMLCIINWYNPFAWLLKRSIRQNLEFVADNKVIENGINKKQYQYLLLKVIGNSQFSIATQFNFSSLKKRIVMMNKTKSAKRQLARFLFLVPVLAIILLSFRHSFKQPNIVEAFKKSVVTDTIPEVTVANSKGYYIDIKDDNGNCTVVVKDKNKKEVKRLLLTEWKAKAGQYENIYGEILTPSTAIIQQKIKANNPDIRTVTIKNNIATVTLNNGKTEVYTLSIKDEKKAFEEKCGIQEVAIATTVASEANVANTVNAVNEVSVVNETIADDFEINDKKAVMHLRNGKVEEYDLTNEKEKAVFEKKYGTIIKPGIAAPGVYSVISVAESLERPVATPVTALPVEEVVAIAEEDEVISVELEVLLTITKKTTQEELESFKKTLREKGFDLVYDDIKYENGKLVKISGSIKSKESNGTFSGTGFSKIAVAIEKKGEKKQFRVEVTENKKGIS